MRRRQEHITDAIYVSLEERTGAGRLSGCGLREQDRRSVAIPKAIVSYELQIHQKEGTALNEELSEDTELTREVIKSSAICTIRLNTSTTTCIHICQLLPPG